MYYATKVPRHSNLILFQDEIRKIINDSKPNNNIFVVIDDFNEDAHYSIEDNDFLNSVNNEFIKNNIEVLFITKQRNKDFNFPFKNVVFCGLELSTFIHQYYGDNKGKINSTWNFNSEKMLFIPGKIERFNRTFLMYKLYKNNLLQNLLWSFNVSEGSKSVIKNKFLNFLSDNEFENFIQTCNKSLDIIPNDSTRLKPLFNRDFTLLSPWPYDPKLYSDTSFSIISETWYDYGRTPTLTEKTFRPIINKHPFIIMGARHTCVEIEKLGFKTFLDYMPFNYDTIEDEKDRLEAVVTCIEYFLNTYKENIINIQADIDFNYKKFHELVEYNIEQIENKLPKCLDERTPFNFTNLKK